MKVLAIALNTFREAVRDKVLYTLLGFALLMIGSAVVVAELSVGEFFKVLRDLGLAAINLFGVAIAVFVGIGLVWKEIERRTIYTIASKPVARWQFLLGKYLGLAGTLALELAVMALAFVLVLLAAGAPVDASVFAAVWLTWIELLVVIGIAIVFSSFTSPTLAAMFTVGLFVLGRLTTVLKEAADATDNPGFQAIAYAVWRGVPDLSRFNIRGLVAYGHPVEWEFVAYATAYGLVWSGVLLALATLVFQRRDFR